MASLFRSNSFLCAALIGAIGVVFAWQIDYADLSGDIVPLVCAAMCLLASALELFKPAADTVDWRETGLLGIALYAGYLLSVWVIGFMPATVLFVASVFLCSGQYRKNRGLIIGVVFGIVLAAVVHGLFVEGMGNLLPEGLFEW